MRFARRRSRPLEEGESYYVSMTDMMVGVLFIFIILLSFFALQYRATTTALTQAKDAQTAALLQVATALKPTPVQAEVDRAHHVVCLPASALVDNDTGRRCFAYGHAPPSAAPAPTTPAAADLVDFMVGDLGAQKTRPVSDPAHGVVSFSDDDLFQPNSAALSQNGQAVAARVAAGLATRLPCYGYGAPAPPTGCDGRKLAVVNVLGQAGFDAFSEAGRAAAALSLQRSVTFHQALTAAQPVLGQLTNAPAGQPGAQPLLRVASVNQSEGHAPAAGAGQSIQIVFVPAP